MSTGFNRSQLSYLEGFVQKCAELDVDPEACLAAKVAAEQGPVSRVAGGAGKGALAGAAIGAAGGAAMTAPFLGNVSKGERLAAMVRSAIGGAMGGASTGAIVGGATRAVS